MSGFNARARYLRGLSGLGITPSQAYRKSRLLAGFNPRARYLRGFGQDEPSLGPYIPITETPDYGVIDTNVQMAETGAGLNPLSSSTGLGPGTPAGTAGNLLTTLFSTPSTAASLANKPAVPATSTTSWFSQVNPTLGISNGILVGGLGAIAAIVLLTGGRKR